MPRFTNRLEAVASFGLGCAAALTLQVAYGWWLNSGTGVLRTSLVLFTLGFLIAIWRSGSPRARAIALWSGSFVGMIAALFGTGPGNIWPIVLAFAASMSAGAVFSGWWIAERVRTRS
jgi:hypothetical protein